MIKIIIIFIIQNIHIYKYDKNQYHYLEYLNIIIIFAKKSYEKIFITYSIYWGLCICSI